MTTGTKSMCTHWERAEFRHADDEGFGCSPWDLMSPEEAERHQAERDAEDAKDPPCGKCDMCTDTAADSDGVYGPPHE